MTPLQEIRFEDMKPLATGAAILGTGGGGDPYRGRLIAELAIAEHGPIQVIQTADLADDDLVIPLWNIGAPVIGIERIEKGDEGLRALRALEAFLGRSATAVCPVEIGGSNSTMPLRVAAMANLPVVDCDGMGRAYPEVQMITPTLFGISASPAVLTDTAGNAIMLQTTDNLQMERLARTICVQLGGRSAMAGYPMTGRQIRESMIHGTLSLAYHLGRALEAARGGDVHPINAILKLTRGYRLFEGKVIDVARRLEKGWARGYFDIENNGRVVRVDFQNEFLIARELGMKSADQLLCAAPDLIMSVESDTGEPITTETMRYGYRVTLIGMPCNPRWRTPAGLALGGVGYFGYDLPYRPVEEIMRGSRI